VARVRIVAIMVRSSMRFVASAPVRRVLLVTTARMRCVRVMAGGTVSRMRVMAAMLVSSVRLAGRRALLVAGPFRRVVAVMAVVVASRMIHSRSPQKFIGDNRAVAYPS
jgi:hypothetical protein